MFALFAGVLACSAYSVHFNWTPLHCLCVSRVKQRRVWFLLKYRLRVLCFYLLLDPRYGALFLEQVEFTVKCSAVVSRLHVYSRKRRFRGPDINVEQSGYRTYYFEFSV